MMGTSPYLPGTAVVQVGSAVLVALVGAKWVVGVAIRLCEIRGICGVTSCKEC